jgi:hypothetical protein
MGSDKPTAIQGVINDVTLRGVTDHEMTHSNRRNSRDNR